MSDRTFAPEVEEDVEVVEMARKLLEQRLPVAPDIEIDTVLGSTPKLAESEEPFTLYGN